ncbi:MAG: AAA family ATPase, partial [Oscillospiraceae bacterium]|nr:AAA family ATPase [Oscillospiraceae bacterium]
MANGLRLSYLYLDQYRTIENAEISFDHSVNVERKEDKWKIQRVDREEGNALGGPFFYGDKVYSMSCIVGKNGEGKTSLAAFLHECFLLLLNDINKGISEIDTHSSCVIIPKRRYAFYHMEKETRFLVVFSVNGYFYYLTNITNVEAKEVRPYLREDQKYVNLKQFCFAFFSMMRYRYNVPEEEMRMGREKDLESVSGRVEVYQSDYYDGNSIYRSVGELFGRYMVNLSEERMNSNRVDGQNKNLDILMQLTFLYTRRELAYELLDKYSWSRMQANSIYFEGEDILEENLFNMDLDSEDAKERFKDIINKLFLDPLAYLRCFSAGEYSRFALFSRLHWFLEGTERIKETPFYSMLIDDDIRFTERMFFNRNISNINNAVLLFDEGDLFYHPEWQRSFVRDIIKMVTRCARGDMQVIFTTNSPFMMSDFLREDIVTLTREKNRFDENVLTFGQNIHTLLAHRFFLDSTIGRFSEDIIGWLICLLEDPTDKIQDLEKNKKNEKKQVVEKETKVAIIWDKMKREEISANLAEKQYVNQMVYDRFTVYCDERGWDNFSNKNEFEPNRAPARCLSNFCIFS